jgi:hypothetical protein
MSKQEIRRPSNSGDKVRTGKSGVKVEIDPTPKGELKALGADLSG